MKEIYSPLTQSKDITFVRAIKADTIIDHYQNNAKVDVSKYFKNCVEVQNFECNKSGFQFYYPFHLDGDEAFYAQLAKQVGYYTPTRWKTTYLRLNRVRCS